MDDDDGRVDAFENSDIRRPGADVADVGRRRSSPQSMTGADADADARDFTACDAAVFDCDGTLVDTMGLFYAADVRACEEVGVRMSKEVFYRLAGVPIREIFRRLAVEQGKDMTAHELDVMVDRCGAFAHELGTPKAIECVIDVAREAKARGLRVGVASSGVKTTVMKHLREHGLLDLFECVVTCEDVEHGKPAPDLYALAAKTLGVAPERCVAYEDAELGIESALAAGYARCVDVRKMSKYEPTDYLSGGNEP